MYSTINLTADKFKIVKKSDKKTDGKPVKVVKESNTYKSSNFRDKFNVAINENNKK